MELIAEAEVAVTGAMGVITAVPFSATVGAALARMVPATTGAGAGSFAAGATFGAASARAVDLTVVETGVAELPVCGAGVLDDATGVATAGPAALDARITDACAVSVGGVVLGVAGVTAALAGTAAAAGLACCWAARRSRSRSTLSSA